MGLRGQQFSIRALPDPRESFRCSDIRRGWKRLGNTFGGREHVGASAICTAKSACMCGLGTDGNYSLTQPTRGDRSMPRVTVALFGSKQDAFKGGNLSSQGPDTWDEREKCELEVGEAETLGSILMRAGTEMGVSGPMGESPAPVPSFISSFDEQGQRQSTPMSHAVNLVNDSGMVRWNVPYESVTYAEYQEAIEAKAMPGHPDRLYYTPWPAMGNGVIPTRVGGLGAEGGLRRDNLKSTQPLLSWERIRDTMSYLDSKVDVIRSNRRLRTGDPEGPTH